MAEAKPLPALPTQDNVTTNLALTTLSTDARSHRGRLIHALLTEEGIEGEERDAWAASLQEALDALSDGVARGRWLAGVKRARRRTERDSDTLSLSSSIISVSTTSTTSSVTPDTLAALRVAIAQPIVPSPDPEPRHLLLCVGGSSRIRVLPSEDSGFNLVAASVGCQFRPGAFDLPDDDSEARDAVLFGLEEWDDNLKPKLVGGTFIFKGVTSPSQHTALIRILRLAIYTHLSLLLEQHFLSDSNVALTFPPPRPRPAIVSALSYQPPTSPAASTPRSTKDKTFLPNILSFFSKKGHTRLSRSLSIAPSNSRASGTSLDLTRKVSPLAPSRSSEDGNPSRMRRFSFISASSPPQSEPSALSTSTTNHATFTAIHARLLASSPLLSSSAGVRVSPPRLITELSDAEKARDTDGKRRLKGDERVGLASIRGWGDASFTDKEDPTVTGKEAKARALVGATGFARMQEIVVLISWGVPIPPTSSSMVTTSTATSSSASSISSVTSSTSTLITSTHVAQCLPPRTQTLRFYARDGCPGSDRSFGEVVSGWCRDADSGCSGHEFFGGHHPYRKRRARRKQTTAAAPDDVEDKEVESEEPELVTSKKGVQEKKCGFKRGDHVLRMVHGGVRVEVRTQSDEMEEVGETCRESSDGSTAASTTSKDEDDSKITTWLSCSVCGKKTPRKTLSDGAFLFSFGKFLEVLIYSPLISRISPSLCEHTNTELTSTASTMSKASSANSDSTPTPSTIGSPASDSTTPTPSHITASQQHSHKLTEISTLPSARFNIVRHFSSHGHVVSFSINAIEDIFELRVPRFQITRSALVLDKEGKGKAKDDTNITKAIPAPIEEEKKVLRKEIKAWWESVADNMEKLETSLVGSTLVGFRKSLPRLPSEDDAWDEYTSEDDSTDTECASTHELYRPATIAGLPPSAPTTPPIAKSSEDFFHPVLNRASSLPVPIHSPPEVVITAAPPSAPLNVSSPDSIELLGSLRQAFQKTEQELYTLLSHTSVSTLNDVRWAFLGKAKGAEKRLLAWQKKHLPGRGKRAVQMKLENVKEPEWWKTGNHVAPGCNVVVREDDWGSIIAFTMSTSDYSRELTSMSIVRPSSTAAPLLTPTSVEPSSSPSSALPDPDQEDVVWYEPESYSAVISRKEHPRDATSLLSLREVLRQKSPIDGVSLLPGGASRFSSLGSAATKASSKTGPSSIVPPSAWSKPDVQITKHDAGGEVSSMPNLGESAGKILHGLDSASSAEGHSRPSSALSGSFLVSSVFTDGLAKRNKTPSIISVESDSTVGGKVKDEAEASGVDLPTPTPSSFTNTLTSGISHAMRFMLNNSEMPPPADAFAIDERPHIKYDWTVGKRLKFSCTIYYAKQFDNLRKRCGIEDFFLKSLSRSANWAAEGGKSKSNFWKTADDRFIIKTLVNAWNVADLQVLLELAPSYFRYMDATASRATVLAKLIGFYTIEIRNLETGNVQSKADLLVMENLFYDQKIVKTFDLKGIQGRKVKSRGNNNEGGKTLFDGEWIEGQQRTLTLIHPHSKAVLQEAIRSDADFLARSNIMDYSLLLGVDQERKQIVCGLVDTIGSYTFAKTLEYKAKQGLNSGTGKEVTVIPPAEYQERFVSALEGYFVACPDKWTRPTDDSKPIDDPDMLPSVL
ncbi:hypothetical protein MIND_00607600 [Mycena indigotica]|uniref:PIPK domain-containing protein n=1 Tax=Mycena indigotica TaxID=2126181 RepID=A0A8H6SRM6_9AGAR|nr:uncharacterized protein MIND_00607600 [Mycena indigotica]KAF7303780.1 hypothetical protein MIND_00607600 [Mycena indigotica]